MAVNKSTAVKVVDQSTNTKSENPSKNDDHSSQTVVLKRNPSIGPGYYAESKVITAPYRSFSYSSKFALAGYQTSFMNSIKSGAISGWKKYKVLPSVSAAQAIIESGWGRSDLAVRGKNLFGIKGSYNGQSIYFPTQEYVNGRYITINAAFRKYPNWSASVEDHGAFLAGNSRYKNLLGVTNYKTVAKYLQSDGYATAPTYAQTLINCIEDYNLNSWDSGQSGSGSGNSGSTTNESGNYTFKTATNIRTAPSTSASIVGQYNAGDTVHYIGKVVADGYTWLKYVGASGATRYVAVVNASSSGSTTNESGNYTFKTATNIRTAPSTSASIVGQY
ncbi:glucosaminidase domain-containing protein, partial [Lactiplantibacillus plantarum]